VIDLHQANESGKYPQDQALGSPSPMKHHHPKSKVAENKASEDDYHAP
jgi:hypothetical protein